MVTALVDWHRSTTWTRTNSTTYVAAQGICTPEGRSLLGSDAEQPDRCQDQLTTVGKIGVGSQVSDIVSPECVINQFNSTGTSSQLD